MVRLQSKSGMTGSTALPACRPRGRQAFVFRQDFVWIFRHQGQAGGKFELPAAGADFRPDGFAIGPTDKMNPRSPLVSNWIAQRVSGTYFD